MRRDSRGIGLIKLPELPEQPRGRSKGSSSDSATPQPPASAMAGVIPVSATSIPPLRPIDIIRIKRNGLCCGFGNGQIGSHECGDRPEQEEQDNRLQQEISNHGEKFRKLAHDPSGKARKTPRL